MQRITVEHETRSRPEASLTSLQEGASVDTPWLLEEDMGKRSPLSTHLSHTTETSTLSKIKCERCIFLLRSVFVRSFVHYVWLCFVNSFVNYVWLFVFNWNHFEMRLLNLRINFYLLRTFCPHLDSFFFFCLFFFFFGVVSSFTTFRPNFTSGLLQEIYRDLG